jgi:DNA uptake protein ComE-like DNA-binding protein
MTRLNHSIAVASVYIALCGVSNIDAQVGKRQTIVETNVATEKELVALSPLTPALVKGILERRPFATIKDLDAFLGSSLNQTQRTELYRRTFIPINLNTASNDEILAIPGMGKRMLGEFLEYRPYRNMAVFRREIGKYVDDKELARLEQYVFVPINLNTATDEDILSIPGIGQRLLREFKEYRPYKNIETFRREIGKYVDDKEVARLERYVTL